MTFDPSLNFLFSRQSKLDLIFKPKTVAVVGATEKEGSVGKTVMQNLLSTSFGGEVFPVNPKRSSVLGVPAYSDLKSLPKRVDLVVVVTPAASVPQVIADCADCGILAAVIISAGFKEMGPPGIALEEEILRHARRGKMRIIGPNCLGVMTPPVGLNATFAGCMAKPGHLAFLSQSGALCTAVLDWSLKENVGFSAFVSIGSMVDVNFGDLINYFGNDPNTKSILLYMESLGDAREFLSAAREVALTKPIILIKAGRSNESAKAAASHTGSLAGSDEALTAALNRVGVLRVDTIAELFAMAEVLAKQPRPSGPNLAIITNAGGPGVIATDALIAKGGKLAVLSPHTMEALNHVLPPQWSRNNPVDVLGDASAETYEKSVAIIEKDPGVDGILVILTPQDMTDPTATAERLIPFAHLDKPILASWMGADSVAKGNALLSQAGIPTFAYPDTACEAFALMWRYTKRLQGIYEVPDPTPIQDELKAKKLKELFQKVQKEKRTLLDEAESKEVLEIYDIPTVPTLVAKTKEEAVAKAILLRFPVVIKLYSHTITHKSDVGGVKLNLQSEAAVRQAFVDIEQKIAPKDFLGVTVQPMVKLDGYEVILGSSFDAQFGPVLLFGSGGALVEVYKDRALGIPPFTTVLARRLMEQTKIYEALHGVRGKKGVDLEKLEQILVRFSQLVVDHPEIAECDINPLALSAERIVALDARVILHPPGTVVPRTAIRSYPAQYIESWTLRSKEAVLLRPIRPEDEPLLVQFHQDLSEETVRQRYLEVLHLGSLIAHARLQRMCFNDYDREIALLVLKGQEILGVMRLTKLPGTKEALFAMIVKDRWQNQGIGNHLMNKMLSCAQAEQVEKVFAEMLPENRQMQALCKKYGFSLSRKGKLLLAEKVLCIHK